jgi:rubrerythrin
MPERRTVERAPGFRYLAMPPGGWRRTPPAAADGGERGLGKMKDRLQKILSFAAAREQEAEAFYKDWAQRATGPAVRLLFGELGAREHGHWQLLAHITPNDLAARPQQAADLAIAEELVRIKARAGLTLQEALVVAMTREEASAHLYERLAELGGEAAPLFRSLANEEREHKRKIERVLDEGLLQES